MTNRIQLEPEAQAFAETSARSPLLFTLGPEKGRLALDEVQSGSVSKHPVDIEDLTIADGPSAQVALRILRPENTQDSAACHRVHPWCRVGIRQPADA